MTIALFASAATQPETIAVALRREGLGLTPYTLPVEMIVPPVAGNFSSAILVCPERGVVTVGERTELTRERVGPDLPLVLCAVQMTTSQRRDLYACGATAIVTPESWTVPHIAERILGQLILEEAIQPNHSGLLYGATNVMRAFYKDLAKLAPLHEPVLLLGETGTGKELVAQELHQQGEREDNKFVPINCPEIAPDLLPSELFGHERGSFTNATQARKGLLAEAGRGTIFLDEIGELDLASQAKLLRVLEDRKVRRVGANQWDNVSGRIVLATNRDLHLEAQARRFRYDLLHRMTGFTLRLPPLRERKADIPLLVHHFVGAFCLEYKQSLSVPDGALDCLFRYDWPGNVRELRAVVRRAAAYADGAGRISQIILQEAARQRSSVNTKDVLAVDPTKETWKTFQQRTQRDYFEAALRISRGNKEEAARIAGVSHTTFYEIIRKLKIGMPDE